MTVPKRGARPQLHAGATALALQTHMQKLTRIPFRVTLDSIYYRRIQVVFLIQFSVLAVSLRGGIYVKFLGHPRVLRGLSLHPQP